MNTFLLTFLLCFTLGFVEGRYHGYFIGAITDNVASVGGDVFAVDKTSVIITNFTHDGTDPGTFIYAGTLNPDGSYTKTGYPLTNLQGIVEPVDSQVGQILLQFPEGKSIYDVDWIGVLSRRKKKMIGRVVVTSTDKKNIPGPAVLGPMSGNGALSGDVIALDSQTLMIRHLVFPGNQPETFFMVGSGPRPGPFGVTIPDEDGSMDPLGQYKNRTVILSLPGDMELRSLSWLSLWSHSLQSSLADISIPRGLNIPPATRSIGVTPQPPSLGAGSDRAESGPGILNLQDKSKLNCEVLSPELGLQVRWSVVTESIILQVVSNLGSEMYMAFGVKESDPRDRAAQGDVVVGWINSQTGRGGLDDYFLSGAQTCADGAESCPDTSKPGGRKNVEMLNSVSRDNYTMITFKRPLLAEDIYDTSILTNQPQEIFWSVGYKKAEKRMKNKPLRNADPIYIDFGRLPAWNCPVENKIGGGQDSFKDTRPVIQRQEEPDQTLNSLDDLDSEPSINLRRKYKGKRRKVVKKPPVKILDDFLSPDYRDDYGNYNDYNNYDDDYNPSPPNTVQQPSQNAFSKEEIAVMKKKFEEKLKKDFPKRRDGQKTTLELIPELGTFVEPFFPKGPPPGAMRPGGPGAGPPPPPGPATHAPPPADENWVVPSLGCNTTDNTVFYLQIGPAAVKRGNQGLGQFGQAWYVNGDVAPDLYLVRGHQYTFIVEGGLGTDQQGIIHPFYLTSDNEGGYGTKSDYEARMEEIYGGLSSDRDGLPVPAIMGRLCEWRSPRAPATYASYADFKAGMSVSCQETGKPGILRFSPDYDMPSVLYYQSFSEKLLGGKIHLLDQCHETLKSSVSSDGDTDDASRGNNVRRDQDRRNPSFSSSGQGQGSLYNYPSNSISQQKTTFNQPSRIKTPSRSVLTTPSTRDPGPKRPRKKCPRKLSSGMSGPGGMPKFEHFPLQEIMKEGVRRQDDGDDCVETNMPFGSFDDWSLDDESYDDNEDDYGDDYVQPTKKPLIFKELLNTKPLSARGYESKRPSFNYENNEIRRTDSSPPRVPYDKIPDLPPPSPESGFPNLFENLPGPYGKASGFFGSFNTKESGYQASLYGSRPSSGKATIERVTTFKPERYYTTTTRTTTSPPYYYGSTTRRYKERPPLYQTPSPKPQIVKPKLFNKYESTKKLDIDISNSGNTGMSLSKPDSGRNRSPSPYEFYTPRPQSQSPTPTPYKFYSPSSTPASDLMMPIEEEETPEPLPPPDNFPQFPDNRPGNRKSGPGPRPRHPNIPHRHSPLQNLLNPFKSLFSFGGHRGGRPHPPPSNRRHHSSGLGQPYSFEDRRPEPETVPAPLPPPADFPEFNNDFSEYEERKRRRRKRPKRPLIDDSYRQGYQSDQPMSPNLYGEQGPSYGRTASRPKLYGSRPFGSGSGSRFADMLYSPSDKKEVLTTALTTQTMPETQPTEEVLEKRPVQKKVYQSDLEVGIFNPGSIESESGFIPVMPPDGNAPSLAFSIFDDNDDYEDYEVDTLMERSDTGISMMDSIVTDTGDRGNVVVNIPAPVLPYVPRSISRSLDVAPSPGNAVTEKDSWDENITKNTGHGREKVTQYPDIQPRSKSHNSADFASFQTLEGSDDGLNIRKVHDIRLSSEQLQSSGPLLLSVGSSLSYGGQDPGTSVAIGSVSVPLRPQELRAVDGTDLAYGNTAPYGQQHSSYVQGRLDTRLGLEDKKIEVRDDVVYGKVSETPTTPLKTIENVDERLLEKLALLEKSGDKQKMKDYVSDLWTIMKTNSGG